MTRINLYTQIAPAQLSRTVFGAILTMACVTSLHAQALFADGFEGNCGVPSYSTSFSTDGASWPAPWIAVGGVALSDVQSGRARLRPVPSSYTLARMWAPVPTRDVEVRFAMQIENAASQGVAFLVRHNGGFLTQTMPMGQGYGVFIEGTFRGASNAGIGIWKESAGVESILAHSPAAVPGPSAGTLYRARFQVHQLNATSTMMQAKYWPDSIAEPIAWQVSVVDSTPELQNLSGGIGIDSASGILAPNPVSANALVDDIEVTPLCNPIIGLGAAQLVGESFQFTEGPLWRGDHLLFSDIAGNTIYRLDPPSGFSVFRTPSDQANGLALDAAGNLLAAEHATRRVSSTDAMTGVRTTLVDRYQGLRFNSPNDLQTRSDGTLYFTDPDFGLTNPAVNRELQHNSLYRRAPDGALSLEWMGTIGVNQPNGVQLSLDGTFLFLTDTSRGELRRWNVAASGALSNPVILATGLATADGMCMDSVGNIYVTVASGVEIFTVDGARWGNVAIPRMAANCAFGDSDGRSLYVTARQGLYRVR